MCDLNVRQDRAHAAARGSDGPDPGEEGLPILERLPLGCKLLEDQELAAEAAVFLFEVFANCHSASPRGFSTEGLFWAEK